MARYPRTAPMKNQKKNQSKKDIKGTQNVVKNPIKKVNLRFKIFKLRKATSTTKLNLIKAQLFSAKLPKFISAKSIKTFF